MGGLGNKMFNYLFLHILQVRYGLEVFATQNVVQHLGQIFQHVSHFPTAETSLCGYSKFWKQLEAKMFNDFDTYAREKITERKNQTKDMFSPERNNNLISVLHVKPDIDDELLSYSSFGWQEFPQDFKHIEKTGKAYFVFPHGFTLDGYDQILGEDSQETLSDLRKESETV
eukprot:TRINITY_DN22518_c0_g1_i6.p1 TRINITY_DN22518_c0_g1~~TRINITY_DN22518_c0_g1_i6.p1  ORF type:complete len:197 (+),score=49.49 TRINITY_DN22518_c0_g1_i6:81-593(+)